jgi:hypothetical protein
MEKLRLEIVEKGKLNELRVKYTLEDQIWQAQRGCPEIEEVKDLIALFSCFGISTFPL